MNTKKKKKKSCMIISFLWQKKQVMISSKNILQDEQKFQFSSVKTEGRRPCQISSSHSFAEWEVTHRIRHWRKNTKGRNCHIFCSDLFRRYQVSWTEVSLGIRHWRKNKLGGKLCDISSYHFLQKLWQVQKYFAAWEEVSLQFSHPSNNT